jgi:hypothetical protein
VTASTGDAARFADRFLLLGPTLRAFGRLHSCPFVGRVSWSSRLRRNPPNTRGRGPADYAIAHRDA